MKGEGRREGGGGAGNGVRGDCKKEGASFITFHSFRFVLHGC